MLLFTCISWTSEISFGRRVQENPSLCGNLKNSMHTSKHTSKTLPDARHRLYNLTTSNRTHFLCKSISNVHLRASNIRCCRSNNKRCQIGFYLVTGYPRLRKSDFAKDGLRQKKWEHSFSPPLKCWRSPHLGEVQFNP